MEDIVLILIKKYVKNIYILGILCYYLSFGHIHAACGIPYSKLMNIAMDE